MPGPSISYLGLFTATPGNFQAARPPRLEFHSVLSWTRNVHHPRIWVPCGRGRWYLRGRWVVMGPVLRHYLPDLVMMAALFMLLGGAQQGNLLQAT